MEPWSSGKPGQWCISTPWARFLFFYFPLLFYLFLLCTRAMNSVTYVSYHSWWGSSAKTALIIAWEKILVLVYSIPCTTAVWKLPGRGPSSSLSDFTLESLYLSIKPTLTLFRGSKVTKQGVFFSRNSQVNRLRTIVFLWTNFGVHAEKILYLGGF